MSESGRFSRINSPDALSTHEREPYSNVTGISFRRVSIRLTIGCLAQPRVADIAWKAASPLQKYTHTQSNFHITQVFTFTNRASGIVELIMSDPLYIFMIYVPFFHSCSQFLQIILSSALKIPLNDHTVVFSIHTVHLVFGDLVISPNYTLSTLPYDK
jgi:hypothetical protein